MWDIIAPGRLSAGNDCLGRVVKWPWPAPCGCPVGLSLIGNSARNSLAVLIFTTELNRRDGVRVGLMA
jgi:hypothetical protein